MVQPCLFVAKENVWKREILAASKPVLSENVLKVVLAVVILFY